jgi:hypothetical protein
LLTGLIGITSTPRRELLRTDLVDLAAGIGDEVGGGHGHRAFA